MKEQIKNSHWEKLKVVDGLAEGQWVVALRDIHPNEIVCNYGGSLADADANEFLEGNYVFEFSYSFGGHKRRKIANISSEGKSVGMCLNHSSVHPNVKPKVYVTEEGTPEVLFVSLREIAAGEHLCWDYGKDHKGLNRCLSTCLLCG